MVRAFAIDPRPPAPMHRDLARRRAYPLARQNGKTGRG
jgi:hypothetical protein